MISPPTSTDTPQPLPQHDNNLLVVLTAPELLDLLIRDEDRAPRNLIDECAQRGDTMIDVLRDVLEQGRGWKYDSDNAADSIGDGEHIDTTGHWWLLHHAMMILGLMPSETAGVLLTQYMRRIDEEDDDNLQDWLAGKWPALFRNKPTSVMPALRALCEDRELDWYIRSDAVETALACAHAQGEADFDAALDWAAGIAANKDEDWDVRTMTGNTLLDFAPGRHRALLEDLARQQSGLAAVFSVDSVAEAYATDGRDIQWERFADPWDFYTPESIEKRQQRWRDKDDKYDEDNAYDADNPSRFPGLWGDDAFAVETYVRASPKVGRNDPCPCGSGKKFKKCCIDNHPV